MPSAGSSALKLFLRNLDEPLTTFEFYNDFIVAVSLKDPEHREAQMGHVLGHLPLYNFHTLKVLIQHLHRIADSVAETKMKKSNLAAVFAPTLMQCPSGDDEGKAFLSYVDESCLDESCTGEGLAS